MKKVVDWGNWAVAAFFAVGGLSFLLGVGIPSLIHGLRSGQSFYPFYMNVLGSLPYLICAWGMLTWRLWAHRLAIILSIFGLLSLVVALVVVGMSEAVGSFVSATILGCISLTWLLLPRVRAEYQMRSQLA